MIVRGRARLGALAIGLALAASTPAAVAGDYDHQDGFFLRLSAGVGGVTTELDAALGRYEMSGAGSDLNFAIGGIVAPNLALHGTLCGWMADRPDFDYAGQSGEIQGDVSVTAIGVGVTYYVMPLNLYFSGSLGAGSLEVETAWDAGETDVGFVLDATVGKEWWVGRNWGLGVAAGFGFHSMPEENLDEDWQGTSLAVRFSATMN